MEFFKTVHSPDFDVGNLKNLFTIDNLTNLCASISAVTSQKENSAEIFCLWGVFNLTREEIRYGIRFSLLNCPHALAWTITFHELSQDIVIHCTIDKTNIDSDFVDSIYEFIADWSKGVAKFLQ